MSALALPAARARRPGNISRMPPGIYGGKRIAYQWPIELLYHLHTFILRLRVSVLAFLRKLEHEPEIPDFIRISNRIFYN